MTLSRRVWLLGGLRVEVDGTPVRVPGGNAQRLFTYLILHAGTPHTRDQLADLLWPDGDPNRVGRYLSDLLYRLQQAIGEDWLVTQSTHVTLDTTGDLWVDVWAFESLCRHDDPTRLDQAIALYAGDLAPEIYDDWIVLHRVSLEEKYLTCLLRLGRSAEHRNEHESAYQYYERIRQQNPLYEEAYRGVMHNLAGMGRLTEALDVYRQLENVLDEELGAPPALETRALAEQLRSDAALQRTDDQRIRRPFIGRISERGILLDRLEQARDGDGGGAIVLGDAGIGKTRLLEELARAAGWRGWQIGWGRGEEFTRPATYAPLTLALQDALPRPRIQQLKQVVAPAWLDVAGRIIPGLGDVVSTQRAEPESPSAEQNLPVALHHLLVGLQQIAPHLLFLDDVQWADPAVWPLLDKLRPHLSGLKTLIVLSGRLDALREQHAAWDTISAWERAGAPVFHLQGLSATEIEALANTASVVDIRADDIAQVHIASGGNPLLALTLFESDEPGDISPDSSLMTLLQRRCTRLPAPAMHAVQAAAVLGYRFTYKLWEAVVEEVEAADLPQIAGALERAQILVIERDGYRFKHDTLRAAAYQLAEDDLQRLHCRTLDALKHFQPNNTSALLYHAEQAGTSRKRDVATYALRAGHEALGAFSYNAAVEYFSRALTALADDEVASRYEAIQGRLRARHILAERDAERADIATLEALAASLGDERALADVAGWQARFAWATGALTQAEEAAERGITLVQQAGARKIEADLLHLLGQAVRNQGDYMRAQRLVTQAQQRYMTLGSRRGEAVTTDLLGGIAWNIGDHPTAAEHHAAAADLFEELGDLQGEAQALNNLGTAYWGLGDYAQARETHRRALAVNRTLENTRGEADNLDNLGGVAWVLGNYDEAISLYQQALTIRQEIEDRWGISISLGNLGSAYRLKGEWETALSYYARALAVNRETGRRSGQGYNLHGRGLALLDAARCDDAREALEAAYRIRQELGETSNRLETVAGLILTCLAAADLSEAESYAREADSLMAAVEHPRAALRQWVAYALYRVCEAAGRREEAVEHLCQARDAMRTIAEPLTAEDRTRFLEHVPLNRTVRTAIVSHSRTRTVRLVHADVPLGRSLSDDDYVEITWTVHAPCDDLIAGSVERRQHVLKRLLSEAAEQNVAPTDADLSDALDVSIRTIARDIAALQDAGCTVSTRRR